MIKFVIFVSCLCLASGFPRSKRLPGRIVGGESANIEDFPHQLALLYFTTQICGASLISNQIALTAAHCTDGLNFEMFSVRAGSSYNDRDGVVVKATQVIQHEEFDDKTLNFDVSVLKLAKDVLASHKVPKVIKLTTEEPATGTELTVSGWGTIYEGGPQPSKLRKVNVHSISRVDCQKMYPKENITQEMICAYDYGKDSCQGDSGGPIINQDAVQVGVVSWGYGCAGENLGGVYTNVAHLLSWIESKEKMLLEKN